MSAFTNASTPPAASARPAPSARPGPKTHTLLGSARARTIRSGPQTKVQPGGIPPFQRFLDEYRDDVWRFLLASVERDEAEDCFQETFIAALRAYPRLRRGSNLRAWVLTIAHRKALDAHRARARRALPSAEIAETVETRTAHDEDLWQTVYELPERQRAAVVLRFVGDLRHREIAATIGCSEEAARRSLHEGLRALRRNFAQEVTNAS